MTTATLNLIKSIVEIHDRCRNYALEAAHEFVDLGETLFAEIYESRARDIEHQRDRHIRTILERRRATLTPCSRCGQVPVVVTSDDDGAAATASTMLACACAGGPT